MWRNFSTWQIFSTFLMWRNFPLDRFPHICNVEKFPHVTKFPHIYHVEKFSTWQHVMGRISPHEQFFLHRHLALSDTLVFLLNEYFIELNTVNFNFLNKFFNWILSKTGKWINYWIEFGQNWQTNDFLIEVCRATGKGITRAMTRVKESAYILRNCMLILHILVQLGKSTFLRGNLRDFSL